MATKRHGITIGIERMNDHLYMSFKAIGMLTHNDYEVMVPMIESALDGIPHPDVDALIDMSELEGWEARAAWDDFRFGLKHRGDFKRVAIIGNNRWDELVAKLSGWFISGDVKYFEDHDSACEWLMQSS